MDELSREFARMLFEVFPEWRGFTREEIYADGTGSGLVVEVPGPAAADVKHGLVIEVDDEVTVGFDYYHDHFDPSITYADPSVSDTDTSDDEGRSGVMAALDLVKSIVSERIVIVSYFLNDEWHGSTSMLAEELPPPRPEYFGNRSYNRIRVRSWSGALNTDLKA